MNAPRSPAQPHPHRAARARLSALAALTLGLGATTLAAVLLEQQASRFDQRSFTDAAARVQTETVGDTLEHIAALNGMRALYRASRQVDPDEFALMAASLADEQRLPALTQVGAVRYEPGRRPGFVVEHEAFPQHPVIEPGVDLARDLQLRPLFEHTAATGEPELGITRALPGSGDRGTLFGVVAIYPNPDPDDQTEPRDPGSGARTTPAGWVYAVLDPERLFSPAARHRQLGTAFTIRDPAHPEPPLFTTADPTRPAPDPLFTQSVRQSLGGADLELTVQAVPGFPLAARAGVWLIVGAGALLSLVGCAFVYASSNTVARAHAIADRVTADLRRRTHELEHASKRAVEADAAKTSFLSSMSHEIRTPLNGIIGYASLLRRPRVPGDEPQRDEWINAIHASSRHLLALLNDVLDLSKLDANRVELSLEACDPRRVIAGAVTTLRSHAEEKGVALSLHFDDNLPPAVVTDATRLRQVVLNLVSNAVKFTEQGSVTIDARMDEQAGRPEAPPVLRIAVRDTGIGMNDEQLARLFNPFLQGDRRITARFGGTGLGLTIARRLARCMGGDITVRSAPGAGSTFTATIHAPHAEAPDNRDADTRPAGAHILRGARVLVADDVEANRDVCRLFLESAGATVRTVDDGRQAVEAARAQAFDLILMDVQMPEVSGLQATRELRELGVRTPIVALTAFSSGSDREACRTAGMDDYLTKPVDPDALIAAAARWLSDAGTPQPAPKPRPDPEGVYDVSDIARRWLAGLDTQLNAVEEALKHDDFIRAARIAHSIKGSGGTLGLPEFTGPGAHLDDAAAQHHLDEALAVLRELRHLRDEANERLDHHTI